MVLIREDKSYMSETDLQAIDKGIAELGVFSLRISKTFTEEEKKHSSHLYETDRASWREHAIISNQKTSEMIEKVIDALSQQFVIYQYKDKSVEYSKKEWDLFFWCNKGDMTYVTLNPNKDRDLERQNNDIKQVLNALSEIPYAIDVAIQYTACYHQDRLKTEVKKAFQLMDGKFVNYIGMTGKVKEVATGRYGFFKKGARTNYYEVDNEYLLNYAFNHSESKAQ